MNKTILPALGFSVLTGLGGYAIANHAGAQGAPAAVVSSDASSPGAMPGWGYRPGGWGQRGPGGCGPHRWLAARERFGGGSVRHADGRGWGLFFPQADKKLTTSDVQTIAESILLRHGNHTWKVGNVAQNQDDTISFAFTSPGGDVIARFAMDIHTGSMRRVG
jgi:hypothetical protein